MTTELFYLALTLVLALVQIFLPAAGRTARFGLAWNAGARDEPKGSAGPITDRLERAQANLFETLPIFAAAVIMARIEGVGRVAALVWSVLAFTVSTALVIGMGRLIA